MENVTTRNRFQGCGHALGVVEVWLLLCFNLLLAFNTTAQSSKSQIPNMENTEVITLGAGCFWCVEAVFESVNGVLSAESGYMGGHIKNPAYREVCTGRTGHAEVVQVSYNPDIVTLETLLEVFFATHDPTTLNRQGADAGTQYRSAIFWHRMEQMEIAQTALATHQLGIDRPIVTEIVEANEFYPAEDYHQAYFELNGEAPYCKAVIQPKMRKFRKEFQSILKFD
jgi:peptide-methionine (S)-S-oxide reductase